MTTFRRVFALVLIASSLTIATAPPSEAGNRYVKAQRHEAHRVVKDYKRTNKRAVNSAAVANRRAAKNYTKTVKQINRLH